MTKERRIKLLRELQKARGNSHIIAYATSTRPNLEAQMANDAIRIIYENLKTIKTKPEETKIDLFLYSNGGDAVMPWRLVSLIREFACKFDVLVPFRAYSAATLTCLGADNIVMHPMGELGPIDPSVTNAFNPRDEYGRYKPISVEDVSSYFALIKDELGSHQQDLIQAISGLTAQVHPLALGNVKRQHQQSEQTAKKLLRKHMPLEKEREIEDIVRHLKSKLFYHGYPINRKEAKQDLKLNIVEPEKKVEKLMWDLYLEFEKDMELQNPFQPEIEVNNASQPLREQFKQLNFEILKLLEEPQTPENQAQIQGQLQLKQMRLQILLQLLSRVEVPIKPAKRAIVQSIESSHAFTSEGRIVCEHFRHPQTGTLERKIMLEVTNEGWGKED